MATRGSGAWRKEVWGPPCQLQTVAMPIYANGPRFQIRREARPAAIQLGQVFLRYGYVVRRIGGYNCRQITGGTAYSSHAWALSIDANDDTNPYRRDKLVTDMPPEMVQAGYEIRTIDGVQVWRWGGDWDGRPDVPNSNYDAMHWEIIATPAELAVGFRAEIRPDLSRNTHQLFYPTIRRGSIGPAVVELQRLLQLGNTTGVGAFGPRTEIALILYQKAYGLEPDGVAGPAVWTSLKTKQPPLAVSGIPPQKAAA